MTQEPAWQDVPVRPPRNLPGTSVRAPTEQTPAPRTSTPRTLNNHDPHMEKTQICELWEQGCCQRKESCWFAHGPEELRKQPQLPQHKTKWCYAWQKSGTCKHGSRCHFVHYEHELSVAEPLVGGMQPGMPLNTKKKLCHIWVAKGTCARGNTCWFAHGKSELLVMEQPPQTPGLTPVDPADQRDALETFGEEGGTVLEQLMQAVARQKDAHKGWAKDRTSWAELDQSEQQAGAAIGYDAHTWDEGLSPVICQRPWHLLDERERRAAAYLGYSQLSWDAEMAAQEPMPDLPGSGGENLHIVEGVIVDNPSGPTPVLHSSSSSRASSAAGAASLEVALSASHTSLAHKNLTAGRMPLKERMELVMQELGIDPTMSMQEAIKSAFDIMGEPPPSGGLHLKLDTLEKLIG